MPVEESSDEELAALSDNLLEARKNKVQGIALECRWATMKARRDAVRQPRIQEMMMKK